MRDQHGYVMISVLFALLVIATVSLNLNREGAFYVQLASDKQNTDQVQLTAEAGMNHLLSRATANNCVDYSDISAAFNNGTYTANILPIAGSPVTASVSATMADGSYAKIERTNQLIYQPAKPLFTTTTATGASGDTQVNNTPWFNADDTNYSTQTNLSIGDDILSTKNYSLLNFDLSDLPSSIKVLSAMLKMNLKSAHTESDDAEISVHRLLTNWDPTTATYNTSDGSTAWSWPDLYAAQADAILSLKTTTPGSRELNLTRLVQLWLEGSAPSNGIAMVANDQLKISYFSSAEDPDPSLHPTLEVRYTCECGANC